MIKCDKTTKFILAEMLNKESLIIKYLLFVASIGHVVYLGINVGHVVYTDISLVKYFDNCTDHALHVDISVCFMALLTLMLVLWPILT